jgi:hypothetical protein
LREIAGGSAMPSAAYFRRQADICLRLALIASDEEISNRLIMMTREYTEKAENVIETNVLNDKELAGNQPVCRTYVAK